MTNRSAQLAAGLAAMLIISNYQYAFGPVFAVPIQEAFGLSKARTMSIFFLFSLSQTLPVPLWGWASERWGARPVALAGGALMALGWLVCAAAKSAAMLTLGYSILAGVGVGMLYIVALSSAVKWHPESRGFASGLTLVGFGTGASLSIIPLQWGVANFGLARTFAAAGLIHGLVCLAAGLVLRYPDGAVRAQSRPIPWREPAFWLMVLCFSLAVSTGLFLTSNLGHLAKWLGLGLPAAAVAGTCGALANGAARVFWGKVSDHVGRATTIILSFSLCAAFLLLLPRPALFVAAITGVFFCWGQTPGLYAAFAADRFGDANAASNFGVIYMGKALGSLIGSMGAAWLYQQAGSYTPVLLAFAALNVFVPLLTFATLRPDARTAPALGAAAAGR